MLSGGDFGHVNSTESGVLGPIANFCFVVLLVKQLINGFYVQLATDYKAMLPFECIIKRIGKTRFVKSRNVSVRNTPIRPVSWCFASLLYV